MFFTIFYQKVALSEGEDREILLQKKAQHEQTCRDLKNRMAVLEREEVRVD